MTQQNDLTAEALRRGATPGTAYVIGRVLSQIFHPVLMSIASIFVVGALGVSPLGTGIVWALVCTAIQVMPPTLFFMIRLKQGAYSDDDISERHQRNELYIFGLISTMFGLIMLIFLRAPTPLIALFTSAILLNVSSWLINLFWKISVHSAGISSFATVSSLYYLPLGVILWLCGLTLGWARVRTKNHTPMQVPAGMALAAACILGSFWAFGLLPV